MVRVALIEGLQPLRASWGRAAAGVEAAEVSLAMSTLVSVGWQMF